jgi:hypothetical protein
MHASRWLRAIAASSLAPAIAAGCGGTTSGSDQADAGAADAAGDQATAVAPEAATPEAALEATAAEATAAEATAAEAASPEAASEDATCAVDADIATLAIPDAAIGDTGASTGGCLSCIQSGCSAEVAACDSDCTCKVDVVAFLACIALGGGVTTCGLPLVSGSSTGLPLAQCAAGSAFGGAGPGCLNVCGASSLASGPPTEGGTDGASGDATGQ